MRPIGTALELQRRRERAVAAVREGQAPAAVARVLGVDRSTVYHWLRQARRPGGLAAKPRSAPSRLSDPQLQRLEGLLKQGATAHGWATDLWTAARVAEVIRRHFGVRHHPEHVRKVLKRRLGWTSQKPQKKARERNEDGIRRWREEEFPRIARAAADRRAHLVFLDESGFQLSPTVRRTLAPRGQTPVLRCWDKRDRLSAISCLTFSPRRHRPGLYFRVLPKNVNAHGEDVVAFLKDLHWSLPRMTVIWDRSRIHSRSAAVREYLAGHPDIVVEDLPGYAPDLNPDELVWGWAKYGRLSNYAAPDVPALRAAIERELKLLREQRHLLRQFLNHTELPLAA
jgi:transposase